MTTFSFLIGSNSVGQRVDYVYDGFCTDLNHVDGDETFGGVMWLHHGSRRVDGTNLGSIPDFNLTVGPSGASYRDGTVSFEASGGMSIHETGITSFTWDPSLSSSVPHLSGTVTSLTAIADSFVGTFTDPDTLEGSFHASGAAYLSGDETPSYIASGNFTWVRNLPACSPF